MTLELAEWLALTLILIAILGSTVVVVFIRRMIRTMEDQRKEQTRLIEETKRRVEAEAIWSTIGQTVIGSRDTSQILTTLIQIINERMNVETGSILLRDAGTDELYFAKILRGNEEQFSLIRLRVGQGIAGWVAETGTPALVPDTAQDSRFFREIDNQTGFKTRSVLCVPLIVKSTVLGVIELINKQGGTFTQDDLHLLETIAAPVAIGIQDAQLHLEVEKQFAASTDLFQKVERAKTEWEHTIDAIEEGISLVDENCRILRVNRTLANWLHTTPSELVGQHCYRAVYGQEDKLAYCPNAKFSEKQLQPIEWEMDEPRLGGSFRISTYPMNDQSNKRIGAVNVIKDITGEKRIQAQMIQNQKLAATGRLAASLAHEINNPLQAIQGCLELTQKNVGDAAKQQRYLTMATTELERLASIVRQMLDFNRPAKGERGPVNLRAIADDVLRLSAKRIQNSQVVVQMEWDATIPVIHAVSNQLQQVFLNLILNAVEAMPKGGRLEIRGQTVTNNESWVTIAFADSGIGIASDILDKIFEPFYTTNVEGTGLGLSVCHNIVSSHGGRIEVESVVGQGSTFTVWLPVPSEPPSATTTA